jgi:hypothetical protein
VAVYTRGLGPSPIEPHGTPLLDWTMGKQMGYGSRTFVQCKTQFGPKEWTASIFLIKKCFVKNKFGNVSALTFYSSLISFSLSLILGFIMVFRVYGVVILWGLEGWGGRDDPILLLF